MSYKTFTELSEKPKRILANYESNRVSDHSFHAKPQPVPQMQRTLGNRNIAQLIQAKRLTPEGKIINLQHKLTVGAADDQYEQEADRVARQVINTPDAAVAANSIQRDMPPEEDKDKMLQTKPLAASIIPFVQRQMVNDEEPEDKDKPIQAKFLTEMSRESLQRQPEADEEAQGQYPPDWQHGAPTKPVPPDPHVTEIPDPNKAPPDQGPYRTPPPQPEEKPEPSFREKIADALKKAGVPAWAVAGLIVLIIAALADPEPFSKVALLIGSAAAVIFFILIGRQSDVPSSTAATASNSGADTDNGGANSAVGNDFVG